MGIEPMTPYSLDGRFFILKFTELLNFSVVCWFLNPIEVVIHLPGT